MTINNKRPWKELNFHDKVFLTALSSAQQLLSPETHSTFIWIMEKDDQLGRCFFWSAEGDFDPSSDNSCSTWADFRVDVSFSPGKPPGRCLVDLKAQGRHLIPEGGSLSGQQDLAAHFIIVSVSCFWREQCAQEGNSWRDSSRTLNFFSHCKIKRRQKAKILWLDFVCTIVFSRCPWRVQSTSFEIHDPDFPSWSKKQILDTW